VQRVAIGVVQPIVLKQALNFKQLGNDRRRVSSRYGR